MRLAEPDLFGLGIYQNWEKVALPSWTFDLGIYQNLEKVALPSGLLRSLTFPSAPPCGAWRK